MRHRRPVAAATSSVAVALTLVGFTAAPSGADDGPPESRGVHATTVLEAPSYARADVSEAWAADIAFIEAEGDMAGAEFDSLVWQVDFAEAITQIQEEYPDQYTSSWLDQQAGEFWVSVPGVLHPRVEAVLRTVPTSINVVESIGWSETEIVNATQAVHYAILGQEGVLDASTGGGPLTGEIQVEVALASNSVGRLPTSEESYTTYLAEVGAAELQMASGDFEDFDVTVDAGLEVQGVELDWLRGGSSLRTCTAGFSVRNPVFSNGVLTAAHCPDYQDTGTNDLTWRGAVPVSNGDVEWQSNNRVTYANFNATGGTIRGVAGSLNPVDGNTYCRYGKTTGSECDSVYMLNRCRGSYCNLVMMFNREAADGDSGGPWFSGNYAAGIHSGAVSYLFQLRDVWTPVRSALYDLGITLKTS